MDQMIAEMRKNFLEESSLALDDCERAILNLANRDKQLCSLEEIIQITRSMRSISGYVAYEDLASFTLSVEDFLSQLENQPSLVGSDSISLLLGIFECINIRIQAYHSGSDVKTKFFAEELKKIRNFFSPPLASYGEKQVPQKNIRTHEYFDMETEEFVMACFQDVFLAVPAQSVLDIKKIDCNQLSHDSGGLLMQHQGESLQLANYSDFIQFGRDSNVHRNPHGEEISIIINSDESKLCLRVDAILSKHEGVIKPFGRLLRFMPGFRAYCFYQGTQIAYILAPRLLMEHVNKFPLENVQKGA